MVQMTLSPSSKLTNQKQVVHALLVFFVLASAIALFLFRGDSSDEFHSSALRNSPLFPEDNAGSVSAGSVSGSGAAGGGSSRFLHAQPDGTKRLLTAGEMKQMMRLPCNYVHDGYYISDSNGILHQVYEHLMELEDDAIPVMVECGGHDGITKSQSLKSSICLHMNTLLIEASPENFHILKQSRAYDFTVHGALCNGESVEMTQNRGNSGETKVLKEGDKPENVVTVQCTSIDNELDKLKATLPKDQQDKLQLLFLVLDVEGHEPTAIDGVQRYSPHSVHMETSHKKGADKQKIDDWAKGHGLELSHTNGNDSCFNCPKFKQEYKASAPSLKHLLYGARNKVPKHNHVTSQVSQAYMYYGK